MTGVCAFCATFVSALSLYQCWDDPKLFPISAAVLMVSFGVLAREVHDNLASSERNEQDSDNG